MATRRCTNGRANAGCPRSTRIFEARTNSAGVVGLADSTARITGSSAPRAGSRSDLARRRLRPNNRLRRHSVERRSAEYSRTSYYQPKVHGVHALRFLIRGSRVQSFGPAGNLAVDFVRSGRAIAGKRRDRPFDPQYVVQRLIERRMHFLKFR